MSQNTPRVTPRFIPQVALYRPEKAARSALYFDWMVDQLRGAGVVRPGLVAGVLFTNLDNDGMAGGNEQDFDGFPGLPSKIRGAALTLDYTFSPYSTRDSDYTRQPSKNEQAERDLDLAAYNARLADIDEALTKEKISEEDKAELTKERNGVTAILDQLARGGNAYLTTGYQMFDTAASGLDWALAVPNVPIELISNFYLERDRAIGFSLYRDTFAEEQALFRYIVGFGNGFTQYAIAIGDKDGNSAEFWHYRNMSAAARAKLLVQLETVLDFGRLTVVDRARILEWERQERGIRAAAKLRDKGEQKLTGAESAQIEALKKKASDLKEAKHLTEDQENQKQDLENKIWLAREQFKLQEESADLIGRRIDVSVQFLQGGYIVVRSGQTQFVYENKRVTSLDTPYHFSLPEKSRLSIHSDGGTWGFVLARLEWNQTGDVFSQPFESWERLDPADFGGRFSGALLEVSQVENGKTWDYGATASASLVELKAPSATQPGKYQVHLHLVSDGRYTPEIYYAALYRAASLITGNGALIWGSQAPENLNNGASRVLEASLQDDKRRSRLAKVHLADGNGHANLPAYCVGLACDVQLLDRETDQVRTSLKHGFIVAQDDDRLRTGTAFLHGNEKVLDVTGCEAFLNRAMTALIPSDGQFPNDYVRMMCRDAELPAFLWNRIPQGNAGFARIPLQRPGRYPANKPAQGTTFLQAVTECARCHCKNGEFWSDDLGLLLDKFAARDRPDLDFGTPKSGVDVRSHLCLRGEITRHLDVSDYVTSVTAIGAKNPITGQRYSATVSIPQATDPVFSESPYFIGYEIPRVLEADESLRSDAACALAARDELKKTPLTPDGLAPLFYSISVDTDIELKCNDLIRLFGVKVLVDSIGYSAFNSTSAGEDAGKIMLSVQLAENKVVPIL